MQTSAADKVTISEPILFQKKDPMVINIKPLLIPDIFKLGFRIDMLNLKMLDKLSIILSEIISSCGVMHVDHLKYIITSAVNAKGTQLREYNSVLNSVMDYGSRNYFWVIFGHFVYSKKNNYITNTGWTRFDVIRTRKDLPAGHQKLEWVPKDEITYCLVELMKISKSVNNDVLLKECLTILGLSVRLTEANRLILEDCLSAMEKERLIKFADDTVSFIS